jgi:hypothetical protein
MSVCLIIVTRFELPELEKLYKERKFTNMAVVLNGTKRSSMGYGYGYGDHKKKNGLVNKLFRSIRSLFN